MQASIAAARDSAFVSYSHRDAEWLDRLLVLLKPYVRVGRLRLWADPYARVGDRWEREIVSELSRARVVVLLCSGDFAASDFIFEVELPTILDAVRKGLVHLFCVPVRSMDPEPLGLDVYQWPRSPDLPLDRLGLPEREATLVELVKRLVAFFPLNRGPWAALPETASAANPGASVAPIDPDGKRPPGELHAVPELPPHFVPRTAAVEKLCAALLEAPLAHFGISASTRAGLYGQGGLGKTVLATALVHIEELRCAFPDGIYWLTLGQEPDLVALQQSLARMLTRDWLRFETAPVGTTLLREEFREKACLLVLDDVWHAAHARAFEVLSPKGRMLITCRDRSLLDAVGASIHDLDFMEPAAALSLLAEWAGQPEGALPPTASELAEECGYLPLALSLAGAQVRGGAPWGDVLRALKQGDLRFLDHPYGSVFKSLSASVQALSAFEQARYRELAIFPEDAEIPADLVLPLWNASGLTPEAGRKLLRSFADRALLTLSRESSTTRITFHDLQGDYLRLIVEGAPEVHRSFLAAHYATLPAGASSAARWATLPQSERYLWDHLVHHCESANDYDIVSALVTNGRWLAAKLAASGLVGLLSTLRHVAVAAPTAAHRWIEAAVRREGASLHPDPQALPGAIYNRLRSRGLDARAIARTVEDLYSRVRLLHPVKLHQWVLRKGHPDPVNGCGYSPDGRRILSGSADGLLREWDRDSGEELRQFSGHASVVTACAYSPDGDRVLSASADLSLKEWDRATGQELRSFTGHTGVVTACAYSPDGERVLSASADYSLKEWDRATGQELRSFTGHTDVVSACAYSPDGQRVLSAAQDRTLREWARNTAGELRRFEGHEEPVRACAYSPDGRYVLSASKDRTLREWERESTREVRRFEGHIDGVTACAYSSDGKRVLSGADDRTIREWERESTREVRRFEGHIDGVTACAYSPDGAYVLSASRDRSLCEWSRELDQDPALFEGHASEVTACKYSSDGTRILSASHDGTLREWDPQSGRDVRQFEGPYGKALAAVYSPDGSSVLSARFDWTLWEWRRESASVLRRYKGHTDVVTACAYSPDGSSILSGSDDHTIREWDRTSGKELRRFEGHWDSVGACTYSSDGERVLSASHDWTLREWDRESGHELQRFEGHVGSVSACAYSADEACVLSASQDGTLREWDRTAGDELRSFVGHSGPVNACVYSSDGRHVLSASNDNTVKIWARDSGRCLYTIYGAVPFLSIDVTAAHIVAGDALGNVWMLECDFWNLG